MGPEPLEPLLPLGAVIAAAALDRLLGDPRRWLHPVQVMGWLIGRLRQGAELWAGDRPGRLRWAGIAITLAVVGLSGASGWLLETWASGSVLGQAVLVIALASALAGRSLEQEVQAVLALSEVEQRNLEPARRRLSWIVGRDTAELDRRGILRALAETASENAVDGLFAPLFWMLVGAALGGLVPGAPGPLCLAWTFKAASTLDSMLGYRRGRLTWLGTAGAQLDDLLVWLPCRLVALTLPLAGGPGPVRAWGVLRRALRDGAPDPSPNAGVSQAAYAHVVGVQLGGINRYGGLEKPKPLLAAGSPPPDQASVEAMLRLSRRLEGLWLGAGLLTGILTLFITKALS
ncbi:cobalamin biosynthesis protein CobD [Cyanobium sp. PCC 7001]|uniref:adenosylcobinamide-phosphate synthase CbiB n=1 Tax=Cyanobium sp. PCC 7001 TaxID=180281 RepID=UPI0001805D26|nr:adenosylcobinamide-phosphate synthase CbiB [Cyanobium sp. PCC 7001]EDY38327.1 cobalamin biosynthesis protein CobD [Cyanobium sp. PCC 7001]